MEYLYPCSPELQSNYHCSMSVSKFHSQLSRGSVGDGGRASKFQGLGVL